jgi:oligosaccharyltransferase complex subunit alpha (ribophorin I)
MVGLLLVLLVGGICGEIINTNVNRNVDLTTHIAKITSDVTIKNTGSRAVSVYEVRVEQSAAPNLSFISVTSETVELDLNKLSEGVYEATLSSPLSPSSTLSLEILTTFTHAIEPFPRAINQPDNQLVRYYGNAHYYSSYKTSEQTTKYLLGSSKIESFTPRNPSTKDGETVKYGPYRDIAEKSVSKVSVHFENNSPFLTVTILKRYVEVSHWGNVAVEEHYEMSHTGAKLKTTFSRLDFQRNPIGAPTAIKSFRTVLPASSKDVYYRDDIGNISTSSLRETEYANELEIRPRYPLFGGWHTKYYIGYSIPSYEVLSRYSNQYKLSVPFIDHSYDNLVVDNAEVRIMLPEGASDFIVEYPSYEVERQPDEKFKTYLDTFGRPVLVFKAQNLEENHIKNIEIYYKFNSLLLLQEPMLVIVAFLAVFLSVIVIVRLDFSLSVDESRESRQKVVHLVEELLTLFSRIRTSVMDEAMTALAAAKTRKDSKTFKNTRRDLEALYKQLTDESAVLCKNICSEAPTLADRVADLNRKEGDRRLILANILTLADKVIVDKVSKSICSEQESALSSKLLACQTAIDEALSAL